MTAEDWRVARTTDPPAHECDDGWLDRDADQPKPCLRCKPHLAPGRLNRDTRGDIR